MTIRLYKDNGAQAQIVFHPKNAGEAFTFNDIVMFDTNGDLTKMTDAANEKPIGLIQKTIAATDSDYQSTTRVPVLVYGLNTEFLCDIGTGTGALTVVGQFIDLDGNGNPHQDVDVNATQFDVMEVTKHISTTQLVAKFNPTVGVLHTGP